MPTCVNDIAERFIECFSNNFLILFLYPMLFVKIFLTAKIKKVAKGQLWSNCGQILHDFQFLKNDLRVRKKTQPTEIETGRTSPLLSAACAGNFGH